MAENNEIVKVLQLYLKGQSKGHDSLVNYLTDPDLKDDVLLKCLVSFKECTSLLGKEFEHLIAALLKVNWPYRSAQIAKEYQSFMLHLVSANPIYLSLCLRMIVKWFTPVVPAEFAMTCNLDGPVESIVRDRHKQVFSSLHALLEAVVKLVPLSPGHLLPLLCQCFPYSGRPTYVHACYVENLLQVTHYVPAHRKKILATVIEHMLSLDVRAPRNKIQESEADEDDDLVFDMSDDEESDDSDDEETTDNQPSHPSQMEDGGPMSHAEADRLDALMEIVLEYTHQVSHNGAELNVVAADKLYRELRSIFHELLLPTHASCHVQFILFFFTSFHQKYAHNFLSYLWAQVSSPNQQRIFRQAAAAYLGSLLARSNFISIDTKLNCMDTMSAWLHQYLVNTSDTSTEPSVVHHGPFYSVCQALIYAVTFNLKHILAKPNGHQEVSTFKLQTIMTSRLNPLKFCLPVVARTFCFDMRSHQLCYCDSILERNRRNKLPQEFSSSSINERLTHHNPLDSFFPFDPYVLSRSSKFIIPLYQEYHGQPIVDDDDLPDQKRQKRKQDPNVLDDRELMLYEADELMDEQMSATPGSELLMYSVSPGFKATFQLSGNFTDL